MPSEIDLLGARLARMKFLVDALEAERGANKDLHDTFSKLKREIEQARTALRNDERK